MKKIGQAMGFLLGQDQQWQEFSSEIYQRMMEEEDFCAFPEHGGRMIRVALVCLEQTGSGRKGKMDIRGIDFRRCKLTPQGAVDPQFREKRAALKEELAVLTGVKTRKSTKVINAARRFKERRYRNEFAWSPSVSQVQKLSALIEQGTGGALNKREVLEKILTLTASA